MQIQILKPAANGKYYPNYDELIRNAHDNDERKYLVGVKEFAEKEKAHGFDNGFAYGIVYTSKMACGHWEIFQHPIYKPYGEEVTEENILDSVEDLIKTIRATHDEKMKCTKCTCNWRDEVELRKES